MNPYVSHLLASSARKNQKFTEARLFSFLMSMKKGCDKSETEIQLEKQLKGFISMFDEA